MAEGHSTQAGDEIDAEELQGRAVEGLKQARGSIESFARENPRTALVVALGVGFVLGGGLTPRVLFGIGAIAARRFAREFAREQLSGITRGAVAAGDRETASA
jgi:hypothetical protein